MYVINHGSYRGTPEESTPEESTHPFAGQVPDAPRELEPRDVRNAELEIQATYLTEENAKLLERAKALEASHATLI